MLFKIKPCIQTDDLRLQTFLSEVYQMTIEEIENGILSCSKVSTEEVTNLSWGGEVSELEIQKEYSTLTYNSILIRKIPTIDILNMLIDYKRALMNW